MSERKLQQNLRKLTAFFAIFSLAVLIATGLASDMLTTTFEDSMNERLEAEMEGYRTDLIRKVEADIQTLETLASFLTYGSEISTEQFAEGLRLSNNKTNFVRMAYFDTEGNGLRVTLNGSIEPQVAVSQLNDTLQALFQKAMETEESQVSNIYYDDTMDENIISYGIPVVSEGHVKAIVMASEQMDIITGILDSGSVHSEEGVVAVVNGAGTILVGSSSAETRGMTSIYDYAALKQETKDQIRSLLNPGSKDGLSFSNGGVAYIAYVEHLGVNNGYLVYIDRDSVINGTIRQNMVLTQIAGVFLVLMTLCAIFYGYKKMYHYQQRLLVLAYRDPLTGAYNMPKFRQLMEEIVGQGKIDGCVAAINIRKFKFINELFGTERANVLLCHVRQTLLRHIGVGEFFCRETSDAFYIFLQETDNEVIEKRLSRILEDIGAMRLTKHQYYPIRLYCGVAPMKESSHEEVFNQDLMTRLMFALHRAREESGNTVCFYDLAMHKREQLRNFIESNMEKSLLDFEFRLYLQPKMDLKTGQIGGAEALVRWITSDGKMIYPDQFIPIFEETGFCARLDLYMMEQVCYYMRDWIDQGLSVLPISVNQSKLLFYEEDYVERLSEMTNEFGISTELLTLEILEGLALGDADDLNRKVHQLKEKGFRISMDDFGSGYSSLNTLCKIDIDELKLDRGFLQAVTEDTDNRQRLIMEQIISLAQKMHIATVTEGVETEEHEAMIRSFGCDYGQGYLYSKPIPAEEFCQRYLKKSVTTVS